MTELVLFFGSFGISPFNLIFSRFGYWKLDFEVCLLFVF